ncbi:MAG TPA: DUF429 domain-containing protein, partial [Acidimicrobiales bacterium]|nr:DUF429 domain-containing protein [Acidimicrobiales bacterium]
GRRLARKSTAAGRRQRAALLGQLTGPAAVPAQWGHDFLDAAMAAWVASRADRLVAGHQGGGCDGSTMAFPPGAGAGPSPRG